MSGQNLIEALQKSRFWLSVIVTLLCGIIAYVDYITGSEIRVFPLYFIPILISAYFINFRMSCWFVVLSSGLWGYSNYFGGTIFSHVWIWFWNISIQAMSLTLVAYLVHIIKAIKEEHETLARFDTLTGLANVRSFNEQAPRSIALCKRLSLPSAIAYLDLDNFKDVNDSFGHKAGDVVLCNITKIMKDTLRTSDIIFRFGGDEFVILFPNTTHEATTHTLERLRANIELSMRQDGFAVTASIGAVSFLHAPQNIDDLLKATDHMMYSSKKLGKNSVQIIPFPSIVHSAAR